MKVILNIPEDHVPFFFELPKSLKYINILKEVEDKEKSQAIQDLAEAFNDVKLFEAGKKQLKSANDLLNELSGHRFQTLQTHAQASLNRSNSIPTFFWAENNRKTQSIALSNSFPYFNVRFQSSVLSIGLPKRFLVPRNDLGPHSSVFCLPSQFKST